MIAWLYDWFGRKYPVRVGPEDPAPASPLDSPAQQEPAAAPVDPTPPAPPSPPPDPFTAAIHELVNAGFAVNRRCDSKNLNRLQRACSILAPMLAKGRAPQKPTPPPSEVIREGEIPREKGGQECSHGKS